MNFLRNTWTTAYRAKLYPNYWDFFALVLVLAVITLFGWSAKQMATPYQLGEVIPISLDPTMLPFYAGRTVVRMLIALLFSFIFTFIFGTWAAKSRRAERLIIPTIDILQSVPILGFLSVTVAGFISLFPGSLLGPECAAIFAIFTSQAWNMAFGFYQSMRSIPAEINEAATMLNLSTWRRFWRIEVPCAMPSLLWNTMASMSAGWFFVVAAEAITVSNQQILLPGIGSFIAVAIKAANMQAITYAVLTMFGVILIYDQLLFRPLVAWAEKFKSEQQASEKPAESWVINIFRRTHLVRFMGGKIAELFDAFVSIRFLQAEKKPMQPTAMMLAAAVRRDRIMTWVWNTLLMLVGIAALFILIHFIREHLTLAEIIYVFGLGLITASRIFVLIILCSFIWVPIGIWIGLRPQVAQFAQPIAQILAAFPANLFYPFLVMFIVNYHLNPNIWLSPLMVLGAQWYILFNVVSGASAIPKDLLQVADNLGVVGWIRAYRLYLPAIFPYYLTGAITAAGGAWNASIVAEVASWGNEKLVATGLGAYITEYTTQGNFVNTVLGIGVMCLLVLIINRLIWRPLYVYAENRFL